ncbi:MAG: DUF924 family protein [Myxococcota bacterium]
MHPALEAVLDFWFGVLDRAGLAAPAFAERWWKKDPAFDAEIRARFADLHASVAAGDRDARLESPRDRLARIVVLDQLSRNLFRDSGRMFACDARALALTEAALAAREERSLATDERVFLLMPLMHSESLADQTRCVVLFEALAAQCAGRARARVANNAAFARRHRDVILRFGRFPHRNALLGRASTEEELAFLEQPGSSF